MIPTTIEIGHYRALRGVAVSLGKYTALVGPNGVGKSTVLDALDLFFSPERGVSEGDAQRGCTDPISITVTLSELGELEREQYARSLNPEGNLVVTKVCSYDEPPRYEISGMRHRGFDELRQLERNAGRTEFTNAFKAFASDHAHYGLTVNRAAAENLAELDRWESEHPESCERANVPCSFVGSTKEQLIPTTRFVHVPAVREASDTLGGSRSPLTQMLKALVYPRFEANVAFLALQEHVQREYLRLFPREGTPELATIAERVTSALEAFCPGSSVTLGWATQTATLQIPSVIPEVVEDGIGTDVDRKGHGLQRALIIAMLQAEDEHRRSMEAVAANVHVVLMIEEPELYQHPTQCRHFRRVLANLSASGSGIKVLVTTHSPDFISLDGIDAVRILRREPAKAGVPARKVSAVSAAAIAAAYSSVAGRAVDEQQLFRQLHVVDSVMREAFFATAAVLVEGVGDHGLLSAQCRVQGIDLEGKGIVIIPCGGKSNMALPLCILRLLGIKHYAVFDADRDPQQNAPLLRSLGVPEKSITSADTLPTGVQNTYAVLNPNAEAVLRDSVGDKPFAEVTREVADEFGRTPDQLLKNPATAERVLAVLRDRGLTCDVLQKIATKVSKLS